MRSVSLHLGVCRVATNIVESMSDDLIALLLGQSKRVFTKKEFAGSLRTVVNAPRTEMLAKGNDSKGFQRGLRQINRFNDVVVSQHALLGTAPELFTYNQMMSRAHKRAANLADIFADRHIRIHLAITPQIDCFVSAMSDDEQLLSDESSGIVVPSWAELITNIRRGCPAADITVWDFEQPEQIRLNFLASLLGVEPEYIDALTEAHLDTSSCQELMQAKTLHRLLVLDEHLQAQLDGQYEADIRAIEEMPNIALQRPSRRTS